MQFTAMASGEKTTRENGGLLASVALGVGVRTLNPVGLAIDGTSSCRKYGPMPCFPDTNVISKVWLHPTSNFSTACVVVGFSGFRSACY